MGYSKEVIGMMHTISLGYTTRIILKRE